MKKTLYLFSSGTLKRKDNTLCLITTDDKKHYFPVSAISDIMVFGEVEINKRTLEFLTAQKIPVHFFNRHEYYIGSYYPREYLNSGYLLLRQAEHYLDGAKRLDLARRIVRGSILNMLKVLTYYANRTRETQLQVIIASIEGKLRSLDGQTSVEQLMAMEGNAREQYYKAFDLILRQDDFSFDRRTRRPPQNRLNALISFGNSILYVVCLSQLYQTHLDPRIGFLHTTNFRRFSLNLDLAEIFKPIIVDRVIFSLINKRVLKASHFTTLLKGIVLSDAGKKLFVQALDERLSATIHHRKLGRNVSYKTLIKMEAHKIEKHLLGEQPYEPFVSRW